ncbi:MAG: XdhC family protein [Phototrophicaceae bacterium]
MHELYQFYPQLNQWHQEHHHIAIASVIKTWGSAPRRAGAIMAITDDMQMIGSVSAGCVESAIVQEAQIVIQKQHPMTVHYGVSDELALDVGLACGGEISIYIQPYPLHLHQQIAQAIQNKDTIIWQSIETNTHFEQHLLADTAMSSTIKLEQSADRTVLTQKIVPPLTLIIIGGNHIAVALSKLAEIMGYHIILIDPRTAFAAIERFPDADAIITEYPHRAFQDLTITSSTAIAILAHDPKIDDTALDIALQSSAFYIGALGGRKTQTQRRERLQKMGLSPANIERLHAPIGLDIRAETPEQIALAILAEIVACRNQ